MQDLKFCNCQIENTNKDNILGCCLDEQCDKLWFCNQCHVQQHLSHQKNCLPFEKVEEQILTYTKHVEDQLKQLQDVQKKIEQCFHDFTTLFTFEKTNLIEFKNLLENKNLIGVKNSIAMLKFWYTNGFQIFNTFSKKVEGEILKLNNDLVSTLQESYQKTVFTAGPVNYNSRDNQKYIVFNNFINLLGNADHSQSNSSEKPYSLYNQNQQQEASQQQSEATYYNVPSTATYYSKQGNDNYQRGGLQIFQNPQQLEKQNRVFQAPSSIKSEQGSTNNQQFQIKYQSYNFQQKNQPQKTEVKKQSQQNLYNGPEQHDLNYNNTDTVYQFENAFQLMKEQRIRTLEMLKKIKEVFDEKFKLSPQNADLYLDYGKILINFNENEQAIKYFDQALQIDKEKITALASKGEALCNLSQFEEAIDCFYQALSKEYYHPEMKFLGYCLFSLIPIYEAKVCYDILIQLQPKCFATFYCKGLALKKWFRNEEDLNRSDLTSKQDSNNSRALFDQQ